MILHKFPDLTWLKRQTKQNFSDRKGWNNTPLSSVGWPNVILNVTTNEAYRPDIRGPLSLFTTIRGSSFASVHTHRALTDENYYFLSNKDEHYTLEINSEQETETFNIHFGDRFCEETFHSLSLKPDQLLDAGRYGSQDTIHFYTKAYRKTPAIATIIHQLYYKSQHEDVSKLFEEECLVLLMIELLKEHYKLEKFITDISVVKNSTKREIFRKLSASVDYLHYSFSQNVSLEELAQTACLSKFHFLRLFKAFFRVTPYQFITHLRVEKSKEILKNKTLPVYEIAQLTGFEDSSTFSRTFKRTTGFYPTQYQESLK